MSHTRSKIKSNDRKIANVKAGNIMDDLLNMRPARAWVSRHIHPVSLKELCVHKIGSNQGFPQGVVPVSSQSGSAFREKCVVVLS